jgi:hypothetical protein
MSSIILNNYSQLRDNVSKNLPTWNLGGGVDLPKTPFELKGAFGGLLAQKAFLGTF